MRRRAQREGWQSREVPREGGGPPALEFAIESLPAEARRALVEAQLAESGAAQAARALAREIEEAERRAQAQDARGAQEHLAEWQALAGPMRRRAEARLQIVLRWLEYRAAVGGGIGKARTGYRRLYEERRAGLPERAHEEVGSFSGRTLRRWVNRYEEHGPIGLRDGGPQGIQRKYERKIDADAELHAAVLGLIHDRGLRRVSAANVHRVLQAQFAEEGRVPHVSTVRRYLAAWRAENRELAGYLDGPEVFRSEKMVAHGRLDDGIERPNQVWELDSTIATVQVRTPEGPRRWALLQAIDVYTRRVLFLLSETSNSAAIALLLRRALLAWGVPGEVRLDNGKDYTSVATMALLDALNVDAQYCRPFHPEEKPFVERAFRSLQDSEMMLLPGQMGRGVAEQKKMRDREAARRRTGKAPLQLGRVSFGPAALQAWLDNWADYSYGRRKHRGIGCSPFERARRWATGGGRVERIETERALDGLLEPVPRGPARTVQKKGIQVGTTGEGRVRWYKAPALAGKAEVGQRVQCYFDPRSAGRICVYGRNARTGEREFLCWAETGQEGEDLRRIAVASKRAQQKRLQEEIDALEEATGELPGAPWLDVARAQTGEGLEVRVIPGDEEAHTTPDLAAGAAAADAREDLDAPREMREENTAEERREIEALDEQEAAERRAKEDPLRRPQKWGSEQACYEWVCKVCRLGQRKQITERDWRLAERFAADMGMGIPPREAGGDPSAQRFLTFPHRDD